MRFLASLLLVTSLTGCQYDRSFLQMNSDSGSPFMGLQLRVDASDSGSTEPHAKEDRIQLAAASEPELASHGPFHMTSSGPHVARLTPTAMATDFNSSIQYSLPETVVIDGANDQGVDVESILQRMSAF